MAAPVQRDIYRPALEYAYEIGRAFSVKELKSALTTRMALSDLDLEETTRGGKPRFYKNVEYVDWKLKVAGMFESAVGGKQISQAGRSLLAVNDGTITSEEIQAEVTRRVASLAEQPDSGVDDVGVASPDNIRDAAASNLPHISRPESGETEEELPDDLIQAGHAQLSEKLASDLKDAIAQVSPTRFEKVVIELLEAMGYGVGEHTGGPHDQGVDGIIRADPLGLGTVYYLQAKHQKDNIGRDVVDELAGSVQRFGASGGVVATTARFTPDGIAAATGGVIRLINGAELIQLMIRHGVGVVTEYTYEIKKLDENYFAEEI